MMMANDSMLIEIIDVPPLPGLNENIIFLHFRDRTSLKLLGSSGVKDRHQGLIAAASDEISKLKSKVQSMNREMLSLKGNETNTLSYLNFIYLYTVNKVDSLLIALVVLKLVSLLNAIAVTATLGTLFIKMAGK